MFEIKTSLNPPSQPQQDLAAGEAAFVESTHRQEHLATAAAELPASLAPAEISRTFGSMVCTQTRPESITDEAGHDQASRQVVLGTVITFQSTPVPCDLALVTSPGENTIPHSGRNSYTSHPNYVADDQQPAAAGFEKGGVAGPGLSFAVIRSLPGSDTV